MEDEKIKKELELWTTRKEILKGIPSHYFNSLCQIYAINETNDVEQMVSEIVKQLSTSDALLLRCYFETIGMYSNN